MTTALPLCMRGNALVLIDDRFLGSNKLNADTRDAHIFLFLSLSFLEITDNSSYCLIQPHDGNANQLYVYTYTHI